MRKYVNNPSAVTNSSPWACNRLTHRILSWGTCLLVFLTLGSWANRGYAIETAGNLLVDLDARDPSAGTATWKSKGTLGDFKAIGSPKLETVSGEKAVLFDGKKDAYEGPKSSKAIEGAGKRTIEVWVNNPTLDAPEETILSWGKRGGPAGSVISFNFGLSTEWGAATHWSADMAWKRTPRPHRWHYLVYTYDGKTAAIYADGKSQKKVDVRLDTLPGQSIVLASQHGADGVLLFVNESNATPIAGSLALATVRISDGVLSPEQIAKNFAEEAPRFKAEPDPSFDDTLAKAKKLEGGGLTLKILPETQTLAALSPKGSDFDFTPGDRLERRLSPMYYNLGDVSFRTRHPSDKEWKNFSSATKAGEVKEIISPKALAAADLTPACGKGCPVSVERIWTVVDGKLVLRFQIKNTSGKPLELGSFGAAMVFNCDFTGRHLDETHERCTFTDPYIGGEGGYLQVTRVNGAGPALVVVPEKGTSFEAYRPLREDPTQTGVTCEGFYEWMVHSKAHAETDWKKAGEQFNSPTSRLLKPEETVVYGFKFLLAPEIRKIEDTLIATGQPVVVGVPGYVLPSDQNGRLFIKSPSSVKKIKTYPEGGMTLTPDAKPTAHGWQGYAVKGLKNGQVRVEISYEDGRKQTVQYFVTSPASEVVERLAKFHQTKQYFTDEKDPFGRAYSYMPWDGETNKIVLEEHHTWIPGLSDESGAGPNLLMAMKNQLQPDPDQIKQLEKYVDKVLWGHLQYKDTYGVRAGVFYIDTKAFPNYYKLQYDPGSWTTWNKKRTETTWRAYNYPHQAAIYWTLYKLARHSDGLVTAHDWKWYLTQAYKTGLAIKENCGPKAELFLAQFGLMDGSVFLEILKDLRREGMTKEADEYEAYMKTRAEIWKAKKYPFGSEMPWDSTGQEEVFQWCKHFGYNDKAEVSLNAILGYAPNVPNWAYNGSCRRYFDSDVYGKLGIIAREGHHYGASLNSIPILISYRDNPDDFYLLRVGYAGTVGTLSDVNAAGHGSQSFIMDPAVMSWEPYNGDFGSAFFGHAYSAGCYVVNHPEFGWLAFGGSLKSAGASKEITVEPQDSFKKRIFLAPEKLFVTLDAGTFAEASYNPESGEVKLTFAPATKNSTRALLRIESGAYAPSQKLETESAAFAVPLSEKPTTVILKRK